MTANKPLIAGLIGLTLGASTNALPKDEIATIETMQRDHFAKEGHYVQCHTYETGDGETGYQIIYEDQDGRHSKGYGIEAADRTFFTPSDKTATSTKR